MCVWITLSLKSEYLLDQKNNRVFSHTKKIQKWLHSNN